jgi:NADH:ubiquinone oxidoreductase subunit E/NAD-dependent dihydropyrimidine dehydrogenase PreA subunit
MKKHDTKDAQSANRNVGSVMVLGGGIGGIEASLDLADSGFKVYLVEESPTIGGVMALLDKTFPTNDCSMCILAPKLVEAGRHLNIELITLADVKGLEGAAGDFTATVVRRARYVDPEKCTGCGICLETCPTRLIPDFRPAPSQVPITDDERRLVADLMERHGESGHGLVRVMQEVNEKLRYLPKSIVYHLADQYSVPVSVIYRIATFYSAFSLTPRGTYTISVCTGTACHIKGAPKLIGELRRELNVDVGGTTGDGLFTVETVRCLGCCSLAPVLKIGDTVYGNVKTSQIPKILKDYGK